MRRKGCIDVVRLRVFSKEMHILTMRHAWATQDSRTKMDTVCERYRCIGIRVLFSFLTIPRDKFLSGCNSAEISKNHEILLKFILQNKIMRNTRADIAQAFQPVIVDYRKQEISYISYHIICQIYK